MPADFHLQYVRELVAPWNADGLQPWDTARPEMGLCDGGVLGQIRLDVLDAPVQLTAVHGYPTDRMSLWYSDLQQMGAGLAAPLPPVLELLLRHGPGCVVTRLGTFTFQPNNFGASDLIVQISGRLVRQWEIWGRVVPGPLAVPAKLHVRMLLDRVGPLPALALDLGPGVVHLP